MSYLRVPKNCSWCRYHDKFYQTSEFARYLREVQGLNVGELEHSEFQRDPKLKSLKVKKIGF